MSTESHESAETVFAYRDNGEHLADELAWLDQCIRQRVASFRESLKAGERSSTGQQMFISHDEVDWLLGVECDCTTEPPEFAAAAALRRRVDARVAHSLEQGVGLSLPQLGHIFHLTPIEQRALVACLAPELDPKYDKLYAYLHDDVTRKRPSVRLVLDLLCTTRAERWSARAFLTDHGALLRTGLLQALDDPASASGASDLARFLRLDPSIVNFLLGMNAIDPRFEHALRLLPAEMQATEPSVDAESARRVQALMAREFGAAPGASGRLVVNLYGALADDARELVLETCRPFGRPLLCIDLELLVSGQPDPEPALRYALRQGLLLQAPVLLENLEAILEPDGRHKLLARRLATLIAQNCQLAFVVTTKAWAAESLFPGLRFQPLRVPAANVVVRESAWRRALQGATHATSEWSAQLARQLPLTPGEIGVVVASARNVCAMAERELELADVLAACRRRSNQALGDLAMRIEPAYRWEQLVLPADKCERLRELCAQVRHHYQVFDDWGFGARLSHGKGLSALFSGPPGTGKTMAAEVIARELGLELYKVDLSGVVSKYIGETEKNLAKIFREATAGNAILFFDEADALFGKRTEVSDAHDRYANIETSYLLQKMEEFEGVAILASNLRENMDPAFVRRLRFIIEFPFPDEASRLRIWQTHFPEAAPVNADLDHDFLAKQFQIAGGNIKNVILNAAFLAAADGRAIGMAHVLHSAKREFEKIGKRWDDALLSKRVPAAA
jgi:DNA polymerase III delta prime subunit